MNVSIYYPINFPVPGEEATAPDPDGLSSLARSHQTGDQVRG
jgi:hypothetical protein